jgi:trimeric autotransporter adhesin
MRSPWVALVAVAMVLVFQGCRDATSVLSPPAPVVTGVSPDSTVFGSSEAVIRVSGVGFHAETVVRFNGRAISTRFIDAGELEATVPGGVLYTDQTAQITAFTPPPGGGASEPHPLRIVRLPRPVITGLAPESAEYGANGFVLTVTGSNFMPESVVRWAGTPIGTTFVSATELRADIPSARMLSHGTFQITVSTPQGGAEESQPAGFVVYPPAPVLTLLPVRGATAGRPGFTLTLHGANFGSGSSVRWNGVVREATAVTPNRLTVAVSSAEVAVPASVTLSVVNAGGTESESATFTIRDLGQPTASVLHVPLDVRDLAWDAGTGLIYVSVGGTGALANTITAVNPHNGAIEKSVFVGSQPNRLARSDDGQFLYVGLDGPGVVRRVDLATFTPGLEWSLPNGQFAGDIEVAPGQPNVVAVSRYRPHISPPFEGVTIYEAGVARAAQTPGHTGANRIEFLESPNVLYGFDNLSTGRQFYTLAVSSNGVVHVDQSSELLNYWSEIVGAAGRIYGSRGDVVDAERGVRLGSAGGGYAVAVDPETGRLFYLTDSGVAVHDMNTFQHLGTIVVDNISPYPLSRAVRWGEDGLAFVADNQLAIVRSPIIGR